MSESNTIKNRLRLVTISLTIVLVVLFLARCLYINEKKDSPVIKVATEAQLQDYLFEKIPGLKRAECAGRVSYPALTFDVPEQDRDIRLEKVWYSNELVYVVYSLGNLVPDETNTTLRWVNDEDMDVMNYTKDMDIGEGALYDNRFYSTFIFDNVKESRQPSNEKTELNLELDVTLNKDEKQTKIEKIPFSVSYDPAWDEPIYLSVDEELPLLEGVIKLRGLELASTESYLYLDFDHPDGKQIYHFIGYVTNVNNDSRRIWIPLESGGDKARYRAKFDAMDTVLHKFNLEIERAVLVGDEKFDFTIDATKYRYEDGMDVKRQNLNRPIITMVNTDISLEEIVWDERGIRFELLYKQKKGLKPPYAVLTAGIISDSKGRGYSVIDIRPREEAKRYWEREEFENWPFPNLVTAYNEKGEPAKYGQRGVGPGDRMGMFLDREFTEQSETIHVEVENLAYLLVGEWKIDVQPNCTATPK